MKIRFYGIPKYQKYNVAVYNRWSIIAIIQYNFQFLFFTYVLCWQVGILRCAFVVAVLKLIIITIQVDT